MRTRGKTCHILEAEPKLASLTAIDLEEKRLERCKENLQRLDLQANLIAADVGAIEQWWIRHSFDRILLDAPCSASGVIRRHPDIKLLRQDADIENLSKIQTELLEKVWKTLRKGAFLCMQPVRCFHWRTIVWWRSFWRQTMMPLYLRLRKIGDWLQTVAGQYSPRQTAVMVFTMLAYKKIAETNAGQP